METITVQQGLNELTLLDKRIQKALLSKALFSFESDIKPETIIQSFNDLVERRLAVKIAINTSNVNTTIKIASEELTVAAAMAQKESIIKYRTLLTASLQRNVTNLQATIRNNLEAQNNTIRDIMDTAVANNTTFDEKAVRATLTKPLKTKLDIEKLYEEVTQEMDDYLGAIDLALTTSNVLTTIQIAH